MAVIAVHVTASSASSVAAAAVLSSNASSAPLSSSVVFVRQVDEESTHSHVDDVWHEPLAVIAAHVTVSSASSPIVARHVDELLTHWQSERS